MPQKFNWHQKRFKDKQIALTKKPPKFLYRKNSNLNNHYKRLKSKLNKEHHWYSGMVQTSNGRTKLHHQIKKVITAYNHVLKYDNSDDYITLKGIMLVKPYICDCERCYDLFGGPAVIDEDVLTNHKAIEAIHQAELIDLKQNFEKWEYKY